MKISKKTLSGETFNVKVFLALLFLSTLTTLKCLEVNNKLKKPLYIIAQYSNENFCRLYKQLSPLLLTILNREAKLKLDFTNLQSIKFYPKEKMEPVVKKMKTNKKNDKNNNEYIIIEKKDIALFPVHILEISKENLKDLDYGVIPNEGKNPTFIEINPTPMEKQLTN